MKKNKGVEVCIYLDTFIFIRIQNHRSRNIFYEGGLCVFNSSMDFLHHFLSRYWNMIVNDMTIHDKGKTLIKHSPAETFR